MIAQSSHELSKWSSDRALWEHAAFVAPRDSTSYYNLGVNLLTHRGWEMAHDHRHRQGQGQGQGHTSRHGDGDGAEETRGASQAEEGVMLAEEGASQAEETRGASQAEEGVTLAEAMFEESIILEPKYGAAW